MEQHVTRLNAALVLATLAGLLAPASCQAPLDSGEGRNAPAEARTAETKQEVVSATTCLHLSRQGAPGTVFDAELVPRNPPKNYGSSQVFSVGVFAKDGLERRVLLQFDLSAIPSGPSTNISAAVLHLAEGVAGTSGPGTVDLHRVLSPWTEATVTWQSFGSGFDSAVAASFSNTSKLIAVDVGALVAGWVQGTYPNHGLMLHSPDGVLTNFWSSEFTTASLRPKLEVCYDVTCDPGWADCNHDGSDGCETSLPLNLDCDGLCIDGRVQSCYTGAPSTQGVGVCQAGTQACLQGQWGACTGEVTPGAEVCDGLDNDCDGSADDGAAASCPSGAHSTPTCVSGACGLTCVAGYGDCDGSAAGDCETDLTVNGNCGACGVTCSGGVCLNGSCQSGTSCKTILAASPGSPTGVYWVDPDGAGGNAAFQAYCDMTGDAGGWTLVMRGLAQTVTNATWNTTGDLNLSSSTGIGGTFKFSDTRINALRGGGVYRLVGDGASTIKRFVPSTCTYAHLTAAPTNGCNVSYSDAACTANPWVGTNYGALLSGISDYAASTDQYFVTNDTANGHLWWIYCGPGCDGHAYSASRNFTMWVR